MDQPTPPTPPAPALPLTYTQKLFKLLQVRNPPALKLYVHESGQGEEPVVLLHGLASTHKYWYPLLPHLNQRKFHYVMPDLLGHGRSPKQRHLKFDLDSHLFYLYRDVFDANSLVVKKPIKGPVHLIGHDLGAVLALEIASRTPKLVQKLTLINLPYFANPQDAREAFTNVFRPVNHVFFHNQLTCSISCNVLRHSIMLWGAFVPLISHKPSWLVFDTVRHTTPHAVYKSLHQCILRHSMEQAAGHLSAISMPVHLIHGGENELVPLKEAQKFFTKCSATSQFHICDHAGHDLVLFNTTDLAALLNRDLM